MTSYYVILTGSKNNAGDFLIKYRAKKLFETIRPDREIVDLNAWEAIEGDKLDVVNNSKALILMGGPSLQYHMYPNIYKLTEDLGGIKVPIVMLGVGWKSAYGDWHSTYTYSLSQKTIALLKRISRDSELSSVRDYHTLNALSAHGFNNFLMTGCPAYYHLETIGKNIEWSPKLGKVAFSLGVSFISSPAMRDLMREQILRLQHFCLDKEFEVVFHHSLDPKSFMNTHGARSVHHEGHNEFAAWLRSKGIKYVDISGSAENLINYYSEVDIHIGYRVHAHIFMSSLKKKTVLIAEDGRAKGSQGAIGGIVIDGYLKYRGDILSRLVRLIFKRYDRYVPNKYSTEEIFNMIEYENRTYGQRARNASLSIDNNFIVMKRFLESLP